MSRRLRIVIIGCLAPLVASLTSIGVASALPQDITISPTSVSQVIKPGGKYSGTFQVLNRGNSGYTFQVYSAPYHVKGEEYTPEFTPIPNAINPASWFSFSPGSAYIKPTQSKTINYTINVPSSTLPGGYYAAAFAQTQYPKAPNAITLNERVGILFYMPTNGLSATGGSILSWTSNTLQQPPLTSTIRIENKGTVNFPATINYHVKDVFGQTKFSLTSIKQILPQTIRRIPIPWKQTPSFGLFKVGGTVNYLGHTQTLSTKWVLVMSHTVRIYIGLIIAVVFIFILIRVAYRQGAKRRQNKPAKKP